MYPLAGYNESGMLECLTHTFPLILNYLVKGILPECNHLKMVKTSNCKKKSLSCQSEETHVSARIIAWK
jgi:hypothetical protein